MIGHHWATLPITAREKESDNLLDTTLNRMRDHMTLGCIPTPPGGNAAIYPRFDLDFAGKISASTFQQAAGAKYENCTEFFGHSSNYRPICSEIVTSMDKRNCSNRVAPRDVLYVTAVLWSSTSPSVPQCPESKQARSRSAVPAVRTRSCSRLRVT